MVFEVECNFYIFIEPQKKLNIKLLHLKSTT